jgi:hypothetical protein
VCAFFVPHDAEINCGGYAQTTQSGNLWAWVPEAPGAATVRMTLRSPRLVEPFTVKGEGYPFRGLGTCEGAVNEELTALDLCCSSAQGLSVTGAHR